VSTVPLPPDPPGADGAGRASPGGGQPSSRASSDAGGGGFAGRWLVAFLVGLGLAAAATGIWFQRHQTRRCLAFYGPEAARRITLAPPVALLRVRPAAGPRRLEATERIDVSRAPGLVHLRRGLVEDANFSWPDDPAAAPLAADAWDVALEFGGPGDGGTTLVIDLDGEGGSLAVVGGPGRIGLGRLGPGLATWIRTATGTATAVGPGR
jgi:hypothetical protein